MGYTRIVYLEHAGANLAAHQAGIKLGLSACSAICRQDQAGPSVRIHSVRANVMPYHIVPFILITICWTLLYNVVSSSL